MEIKRLRHFRTVVEAGGLARAAELLHLTPGALSKSIKTLEDEVGRPLFHRVGRQLSLTEGGTQLYHASETLLVEHTRVLRSLDDAEPEPLPLLRVASFEVFTTHLLARVVDAAGLDLALRVLELPVRRISNAVAEREVDVGITYAPYPHRKLVFDQIGVARFGIYGRRGAFGKTAFDELPFAVPTTSVDGSTAALLGIDGWPYARIPRLVRYELTSLESALALARQGHCVVFIPEFVANAQNATVTARYSLVPVKTLKSMPKVEYPVYRVMRTGEAEQDAIVRFTDALGEQLEH